MLGEMKINSEFYKQVANDYGKSKDELFICHTSEIFKTSWDNELYSKKIAARALKFINEFNSKFRVCNEYNNELLFIRRFQSDYEYRKIREDFLEWASNPENLAKI